MELSGRVTVITGGASGIGLACCERFAAAGSALVIADLNEEGARQIAERLASSGTAVASIGVDVARDQDCADMVALAMDRFGGLDCAVNCAGVAHGPTPLHEISEATWRRVWEVDALGTALCMKYEIPRLIERGSGSIVNIASGAGSHGAKDMGAYVAAKHAVIGITKTAAIELAPNRIRVNAICPGLVATATNNQVLPPGVRWEDIVRNPTGRICEPFEVADMAVWLAGDRSTFVNGQAIAIDGGQYVG